MDANTTMKIQQFLDHHGIEANPFAEEDAQTDPVFKEHCIASMYHPVWDKIYGDPAEPATSVVFGEKGSGKTALRLQIARHLADYNRTHPQQRLFVIGYDDFNPFLDRFQDHFGGRPWWLQQWADAGWTIGWRGVRRKKPQSVPLPGVQLRPDAEADQTPAPRNQGSR